MEDPVIVEQLRDSVVKAAVVAMRARLKFAEHRSACDQCEMDTEQCAAASKLDYAKFQAEIAEHAALYALDKVTPIF